MLAIDANGIIFIYFPSTFYDYLSIFELISMGVRRLLSYFLKIKEEKVTNFLFVYYGGSMGSTPKEQKKLMDAWMKWFASQGKSVVDGGNPTMPGKLVSQSGVKTISGKKVTGYSVFKAENIEAAIAIAKTSPQLDGGEIAVYQIMPAM
jgi:hypothetical protein